jgi:hypothetical protein
MTHELHRLIIALLPSTRTVHLTALTIEQESVVLQLTATAPTAPCPCCTVPSSSVHRRYGRHARGLAGAASDDHRGLSGLECSLRRRHSPWGTPGGAGRGPVSSRPASPPGLRSPSARPPTGAPGSRGLHGDGAHPGRWSSTRRGHVPETAPEPQARAAASRASTPARPLGHDL